jgi:hypothetical protein
MRDRAEGVEGLGNVQLERREAEIRDAARPGYRRDEMGLSEARGKYHRGRSWIMGWIVG